MTTELIAMPTALLRAHVNGTVFRDFDSFKFCIGELDIRLGQIFRAQKVGSKKNPLRQLKIEIVHERRSNCAVVCAIFFDQLIENGEHTGVKIMKMEWSAYDTGTFTGMGDPGHPISWNQADLYFC